MDEEKEVAQLRGQIDSQKEQLAKAKLAEEAVFSVGTVDLIDCNDRVQFVAVQAQSAALQAEHAALQQTHAQLQQEQKAQRAELDKAMRDRRNALKLIRKQAAAMQEQEDALGQRVVSQLTDFSLTDSEAAQTRLHAPQSRSQSQTAVAKLPLHNTRAVAGTTASPVFVSAVAPQFRSGNSNSAVSSGAGGGDLESDKRLALVALSQRAVQGTISDEELLRQAEDIDLDDVTATGAASTAVTSDSNAQSLSRAVIANKDSLRTAVPVNRVSWRAATQPLLQQLQPTGSEQAQTQAVQSRELPPTSPQPASHSGHPTEQTDAALFRRPRRDVMVADLPGAGSATATAPPPGKLLRLGARFAQLVACRAQRRHGGRQGQSVDQSSQARQSGLLCLW